MRPMRCRAIIPTVLGLTLLLAACSGPGVAAGSVGRPGGGDGPTPTPPPAGLQWFFADSWTGAGFTTVITLTNPGGEDAEATITFLGTDGAATERHFPVVAKGETAVDMRDLLGKELVRAHRIKSDKPILVTHKITNGQGGLTVAGMTEQALRWRFKENRPAGAYDKWLELANFGGLVSTVRVEYTTDSGSGENKQFDVPAHSLLLVHLNQDFPKGIGHWTVVVQSGVPIVAEMTVYDKPGNLVADMVGER